jgi:hypothetical protein
MQRGTASLVVAVALHAGVVAGVAAFVPVAPSSVASNDPIDLEIVEGPVVEAPPGSASSASPTEAASGERARIRGATRTALTVASLESEREEKAEPLGAPTLDGDERWSVWSGIVAAPRTPLPAPSSAAPLPDVREHDPAPVSSTGGLREALAAHDRELGLGVGGPVVGVAEAATRSSRAPVRGFAVFEVRFDASGGVRGVSVVDANGERDSWSDVARGMAAALRAKPLRLPSGANGVAVTVRVDSDWLNPDGSRPGAPAVCVPPIPCDSDPKRKRIVITPLMISGNVVPTGPDVPTRQVHARIESERVF